MSKSPLIVYIDDQIENLQVFKSMCPNSWRVLTFNEPLMALEALKSLTPHVVVSDYRMPLLKGCALMIRLQTLLPHARRIIVTAHPDEASLIELLKAKAIDAVVGKPWIESKFTELIESLIETYEKTTGQLLQKS
jgi:response regulator RpfG family c-di-GMP phosphodiesterase